MAALDVRATREEGLASDLGVIAKSMCGLVHSLHKDALNSYNSPALFSALGTSVHAQRRCLHSQHSQLRSQATHKCAHKKCQVVETIRAKIEENLEPG